MTTLTMKETMDYAQATVENVLRDIQNEIMVLAEIYDSKDLFGIAYKKYSDKIIDIIDEYIEK